jgi:hypothetical protein
MASQTPSELAISTVRWRQQPSAAAPRASQASGGHECSLSPACVATEPASAATVQGRAGPAFYRDSPPGAQATTEAGAAVACSKFDEDTRQSSFRCLRLALAESLYAPSGVPTLLDPKTHALQGSDCMPIKDDCRDHRLQAQISRAARLAAAPLPRGQVLFSTALPQDQRAQKVHMHACMVMPVMVDRMTRIAVSVALLARTAAAPETPSEGQVLFCRRLSVRRNCTCRLVW